MKWDILNQLNIILHFVFTQIKKQSYENTIIYMNYLIILKIN